MSKVKILVGDSYTSKTLLSASLTKEGERAVDQMEFSIPANETITVNDKVYYQQDFAELDDISLCINFQNGVRDESGLFNHGTATSLTYVDDNNDFYSKQAVFNGSSSFVSVPDSNNLDLSGVFDIYIWAKWSSTTEQFIFSKRSSTTNGFALSVNASVAGKVKFYIGSDIILSSSSGFNDGNKHLIRINRDLNNLVILYIDGINVGTVTSSYDPTNALVMLIGKDYGGSFFLGSLLRFRIYKGRILDDEVSTLIKDLVNPRSVLKFGGRVTKIEVGEASERVTAQSFGKVLVETEVRGQSYTDKSPEYILNDLITNNTSFSFNDRGISSGLIIDKFIADGKLYDLVRDFASFTNKTFYTTPNEEFYFEPVSLNVITGRTFTHGAGNLKISKKGYDDTKLVNQLTLIGEIQKFSHEQTFSGDGSTTEFILLYSATTLEIKVGGVLKTPNEDYTLDTLSKTVTFTTAPSGTITASFDYEIPMIIKGERASSIAKYGIHAKKLTMKWITNRQDGVRFVQSFLNKYSEIRERTELYFGTLVGWIQENDVVNCSNTSLGISGDFVVKSINWVYPKMDTQIIVGEYFFDYFEDDQEIVKKLHDIESTFSTNKELQDYESPEEVLVLTDIIIQVISEDFSESLSMTTTVQEYDKTRAIWGSSNYGSRITQDVYGGVA